MRSLCLEAGLGIQGDCHADARSPRQVLLTAAGAYARLAIPENSLRENILVDIPTLDWPSGTAIAIGTAHLRVMFRCEPCAKLNRKRAHLSRDVGQDRGLLARVIQSGRVRPGDAVQVLSGSYPPLSDDWRERVRSIVAAMPTKTWLSYGELAELAGVHSSYCRAFPRLLGSAPGMSTESPGRVVKLGRGRAKVTHYESNFHSALEHDSRSELLHA